ncbi:unnamed protein product [Soboliphyme baturini]|uniref:Heterogeneous nuclear ribonucleoprotein K n=1 Tax=Soboliphyme baturini TaxID=241478 RepID=A0A183IVQ3_9BILA|nr:unnamed protein product [Soboliphyme baturini]
MKRFMDDRYYGNKRQRSDPDGFELRVLIPSRAAGAVIGKGGDNIKRLRTENKSGRDEMELRILVHQSQAGAIIGRAGFKIKELRDSTGTSIKVYSECAPLSTDRIIQINGEPDKVVSAVKEILKICSDTPTKGSCKPYDTINYDPTCVYEYGGYPPDRNFRGPPSGRTVSSRGPPGRYGGGYANKFDSSLLNDSYRPMDMGPMSVTIPKELAGTIIGKGGERINRIREDSGAQIVVDPPAPDSSERIITITGNPNQIKVGQYLLQQW